MQSGLSKFWKEYRSLIVFLALMFVFRSAFADWNTVPTGSMRPTIVEGDRILVNKMAYDLRVPFTHISLARLADPVRGDIIVFDSHAADQRLVKRVIGIPGDIVAMDRDVLFINGEQVGYEPVTSVEGATVRNEDLFGVEHLVRLERAASAMSSFQPVKVPEGFYLVLGDNRDNSADSRVIGFVPRDEIVGRSRSVVMSLDNDNYYLPRPDRFFHTL